MKLTIQKSIVAVVSIFGLVTPLIAAPLSFDFTGKVTSVDNNTVYNGLQVNDTFTGVFAYDSGATASSTWSPPLYVYFLLGQPNSYSSLNLSGMVLESTSSYTINIYNNGTNYVGPPQETIYYDSISISASTNPATADVDGVYDWRLGFLNYGDQTSASPLTSGVLPQTYTLSDWVTYLGGSMLYQDGTTTSSLNFSILDITPSASVPEPAALSLLGLGLAGLGVMRRKQKAA